MLKARKIISFNLSLLLIFLGFFVFTKISLAQLFESGGKEIIMGDIDSGNKDVFLYKSRIMIEDLGLEEGEFSLNVLGKIKANNLCLKDDCVDDWAGLGGGESLWSLLGSNVYRLNGFVGLGTNQPNKNLHILDTSRNAEIDIQSVGGGTNNHWGIYNERSNNSFNIWGSDNYLTILRDGKVGIGLTNPNNLLQVFDLIEFNNVDINTQIGYQAGKYDLGQYNTWIGYQSGSANNSTGKSNVADRNTAIGYQALYSNSTGSSNSAVGYQALTSNTNGNMNTAVGDHALRFNQTGFQNSAFGRDSLWLLNSGSNNSAFGIKSLRSMSNASNNAGFGSFSLYNTTGSDNTSLGARSGYQLTTGIGNVFLGVDAGNDVLQKVDANNSMALGASSYTTANNQFVYGNSSVTQHIFRSGNMGLGTSTPTTNLHLFNSPSGPIISLSGNVNVNYQGLTVRDLINAEKWFIGSNNNNNFVIRRNSSVDDLTISSSTGNILINSDLTANSFCLGTDCISEWSIADPLWTLNSNTIHPSIVSQSLAIGATSTDLGDIMGVSGNLGVEGDFKTSSIENYGFSILRDKAVIGDSTIGNSKLFVRGGVAVGDNLYSSISMATGTMAIESGLAIGTSTLSSQLTLKGVNGIEAIRVIASNYSPLVIRNSANNLDLLRLNEGGNLSIFSSIKIGNDNAACNQDNTGLIKYDEKTRLSYICNGDRWLSQKSCGLVADQDGNTYQTVLIGGQCWMAENLNVGVMLLSASTMPNISDAVIEKWCYNNSVDNCEMYGGLYQWNEAMRGSNVPGAQGICPDGWRIPSDQDWLILERQAMNVSDNILTCDLSNGQRCGEAGRVLKSRRTAAGDSEPRWISHPNNFGLDLFSFNALPAGHRVSNNTFNNINSHAYFWSSSLTNSAVAIRRSLASNNGTVERSSSASINSGYSVRCVRDDLTVNNINLSTYGSLDYNPVFSINKNDNSSLLSGSNLLTILSSNGHVGIGTTSPTKKLSVVGDVVASQFCLGAVCINTWPSGGAGGSVDSVFNLDGTLNIPTTTGHVVASLNLSNANTWTASQTFNTNTNFPGNSILNSVGEIGLGTTSPFTKLHLYHSSSGPIISLSGLEGSGNYRGLTIKDLNNTEKWFIGNNGSNNFVIRRNSAVDNLTINSSGNISMSTTTVSGSLTTNSLCLGGDCRSAWPSVGGGVSSVSNSDNTLTINPTTGEVIASLNLNNANTWNAVQSFNQYLGIGTTSPNRHLHIYDISTNAEINLQSVAGADKHWSMYVDKTDNSLRFWGDNDRISILRDGKVGMGTTTPNTELYLFNNSSGPIISLAGDINTLYQGLALKDLSDAEKWFVGSNDNNNFVIRRNGGFDDLSINSSGKVSIGTSSTSTTLNLGGTPGVDGIKFPDNSVQTTAGSNSVYVGITTQKYKGSQVNGYEGGNAKCDADFSGSHMCSLQDINNTVNQGLDSTISTSSAWIVTRKINFPEHISELPNGDMIAYQETDCNFYLTDQAFLPHVNGANYYNLIFYGQIVVKKSYGIINFKRLCSDQAYIACCK